MEPSPKGRFIEEVEGEPQDIISRGEKITALGQQMLDCANTLETIKNQALSDGNQQGKAIEKLKESVGDSHDVLRQAGELYEPVGPVITQYGSSLSIIQPSLNGHVSDCESKWETYQSLPGDAEGSTTPEAGGGFLGMGGHDADSPEAKEEAADNAAKKAAYEDWLESARAFDSNYDSWVSAFEDAADGVEDEMAGSIEDSFWDNISSFVSVVGTILSWAALIVGVIAIFVTGLVVIAALLALASFVIVAIQYMAGEKSGWDLAIAAVSIIPVGKLSNLVKIAQAPKIFRAAGGVRNAAQRTWGALRGGPIDDLVKMNSKSFSIGLKSGKEMLEGVLGPSIQTARKPLIKMYVGNRAALTANLQYVRDSARINQVLGVASTQLGNYGRLKTAGVDLPTIPPLVGKIIG